MSCCSLGRVVVVQHIVNTLNKEGVKFAHLLTTNPQLESGWLRRRSIKHGIVTTWQSDTFGFNPHIAQEITFGAKWNNNFIGSSESTDVVDALWTHRKVSVSLVVLSEETDLWLTSDVHILGTFRYKVNQSS